MLDKLFDLFNKVDTTLSQAQRMQGTVQRVEGESNQLEAAKSSKLKWVVMVIILVLAVLYVFFSGE
ncbi:MAG: hypothetical protein HYT12_03370 [Candidatus Liptonbacteria bacterium]|nr:hypothetical protein [Candidatus Liptonbacteria bacterium]